MNQKDTVGQGGGWGWEGAGVTEVSGKPSGSHSQTLICSQFVSFCSDCLKAERYRIDFLIVLKFSVQLSIIFHHYLLLFTGYGMRSKFDI